MNRPATARRPISAVIITLNAARQLEACIESVRFADEIVIVDSGSTDGTLEIARRHGARTFHRAFDGFGPQKQYAVSQALHDWTLCIDADERISPQLRDAIEREFVDPEYMAYAFPRRNRFLGRWLRHGEGYPDLSLRLFDRRQARWSDDQVHEKVQCNAPVGRLNGELLHDSAETLRAYLDKQNGYTSWQAEALYRSGVRPSVAKLLLSPIARFVKFYILRLGFLDGAPGLIHIAIGCFNTFSKNAKLLEVWLADR